MISIDCTGVEDALDAVSYTHLTCDRIAEENGVSRASVLRASHYTRGIDIADNQMCIRDRNHGLED